MQAEIDPLVFGKNEEALAQLDSATFTFPHIAMDKPALYCA